MKTAGIMFIAVAGVLLLTGCGHTVMLNSNPSGAKITLNGKYIGTTPLEFKFSDYRPYATFEFVAAKEGYESYHHKFMETNFFEGPKYCIPKEVNFDLVPQSGK